MRPTDLITIPPLARTVIYYVLGVANIAILSLLAAHVGDPQLLLVAEGGVAGLSGLFFGVAASNVSAAPERPVEHPVVEPPAPPATP